MPSSNTLTPVPTDHPANRLTIGDEEDIATLLKLASSLPNDQLVESLEQQYPKEPRWREFRNDFRYLYVLNWMYQCRGYIKLANEHFDVDLFEIELFNLVYPPPADELTLLVHRARLALLSRVHGKKVTELAQFEPLFRYYYGSETPLGGTDEPEEDASKLPRFDELYVDEKIEVLYLLMSEVTQHNDFRTFVEKNQLTPDALRVPSLYFHAENRVGRSEDYVLFFNDTALYKRTTTVPELIVPRKRQLAPAKPDEAYEPESFDVATVSFELIFKSVYGLNDLLVELKQNRKAKKNRALLDTLKRSDFIENVFEHELRKRRVLAGRRRESEMARLLATRKRSTRIEAKERQKQEEDEKKDRDGDLAPSRRSDRARRLRNSTISQDYTQLSRADRLAMRKGGAMPMMDENEEVQEILDAEEEEEEEEEDDDDEPEAEGDPEDEEQDEKDASVEDAMEIDDYATDENVDESN